MHHAGMAENQRPLEVPTFLKSWRKLRDKTQEELADEIGHSASSISQLENGKQGFTDKTLADLARVLGCSPVELLAHDPSRADSFWPLFEIAESLEGVERERAFRVISAALRPPDGAGSV